MPTVCARIKQILSTILRSQDNLVCILTGLPARARDVPPCRMFIPALWPKPLVQWVLGFFPVGGV